jgi:hypothetical protein
MREPTKGWWVEYVIDSCLIQKMHNEVKRWVSVRSEVKMKKTCVTTGVVLESKSEYAFLQRQVQCALKPRVCTDFMYVRTTLRIRIQAAQHELFR